MPTIVLQQQLQPSLPLTCQPRGFNEANARGNRPSSLLVLVGIIATIVALGGCANGSGQVVSRLAPGDAMAPPPAPQTLPSAQIQQQRYNEVDKRALTASENALAAENAAKLMPAPSSRVTNIYNGSSRW